jgi:sulfite exporter TauE/SafE
LQGGLLLAALANTAQGGALVMVAFAIGSMPGLAVAPWAWARWRQWRQRRGSAARPGEVAVLGFRIAGAGLVLVSGWALTHGIWERLAAWCAG